MVGFACYHPKLAIDGGQHSHQRNKHRDTDRDTDLTASGFRLLRLWNSDVDQNLEGVLMLVLFCLAGLPPNPGAAQRRHPLEARDSVSRHDGIVAALDAGLAITILPEFNLPASPKALGAAEVLPALPDFEFVLRRSRNASPATDRLAELIVNFFELSTALRPDAGINYKERSHLLLRTRLEA